KRLAQRAADALEACLDHVMAVLAGHAHVHRGPERLRQGAEEMRHQLGRQAAHGLPVELPGKLREWPPRQVDRDLRLRLVHRQEEPVARDADLGPECPPERFPERQRAILHRVMLVDLEIALAYQLEGEAAVFGELLQHVIEEPDARGDAQRRGIVEVDANLDLGLTRAPANLCTAGAEIRDDRGPRFFRGSVEAYPQAAYAEIRRELKVRVAVADHRAGAEIHCARANVLRHQAGLGLAAVAAVALEVRTNEYRVELAAL